MVQNQQPVVLEIGDFEGTVRFAWTPLNMSFEATLAVESRFWGIQNELWSVHPGYLV